MENISMLKKYLIVLSLILSSVLVPSLSFACNLTGIVVQVLSYDDAYTEDSIKLKTIKYFISIEIFSILVIDSV